MSELNTTIPFEPFCPTSPKFLNLTGQRFNRLLVISIYGRTIHKLCRWLCRCQCGNWTITTTGNLRSGHSMSCGCLNREARLKSVVTHGETRHCHVTPEYNAYLRAQGRCSNPNTPRFEEWGGRGIEFRFTSYPEFFQHIGRRPSPQHSLDRIDNDGHYEIGNVRWATKSEQSQNRKNTRWITINHVTHCLAEWSRLLDIPPSRIRRRLKKGWSDYDALFSPNQRLSKRR